MLRPRVLLYNVWRLGVLRVTIGSDDRELYHEARSRGPDQSIFPRGGGGRDIESWP